MDMLLGLDMLKRHQCTIDLQNNVLRFGTCGTETTFLPENELPTHSRLTYVGDDAAKAEEADLKATADALEAAEILKAIERSRTEKGKRNHLSSRLWNGKNYFFFLLILEIVQVQHQWILVPEPVLGLGLGLDHQHRQLHPAHLSCQLINSPKPM